MKIFGWFLVSIPFLGFLGIIIWLTTIDWIATWATLGGVGIATGCAYLGMRIIDR